MVYTVTDKPAILWKTQIFNKLHLSQTLWYVSEFFVFK